MTTLGYIIQVTINSTTPHQGFANQYHILHEGPLPLHTRPALSKQTARAWGSKPLYVSYVLQPKEERSLETSTIRQLTREKSVHTWLPRALFLRLTSRTIAINGYAQLRVRVAPP